MDNDQNSEILRVLPQEVDEVVNLESEVGMVISEDFRDKPELRSCASPRSNTDNEAFAFGKPDKTKSDNKPGPAVHVPLIRGCVVRGKADSENLSSCSQDCDLEYIEELYGQLWSIPAPSPPQQ